MLMHITFDSLKTFYNILLQKLKNYRGNWEQNDPAADDYIKNRPFYSKVEEIVILPEITLQGDDSLNLTTPFVEGNAYKVVWDGAEYSCIAKKYDGYIMIGNNALYEYDNGDDSDTGEPFAFECENGSTQLFCCIEIDTTHTVQISTIAGVIKEIDVKYIPKTITKKVNDTVDAVESLNEGMNYLAQNAIMSSSKTVNDTITVSWDGTFTSDTDNFTHNAYKYYKVSSEVPSYDRITSISSNRSDGGTSSTKTLGTNCYKAGHAIVVTIAGVCKLSNISFNAPSAGIYFYYNDPTLVYQTYIRIITNTLVDGYNMSTPDGSTQFIYLNDNGTFDSDRIPLVPIEKGGTNANTAKDARINLGVAAVDHKHDNYMSFATASVAFPIPLNCSSYAYGNGMHIAIGRGSDNIERIANSRDGFKWDYKNLTYARAVCFGNGTFVMMRDSGAYAYYSEDGLTWKSATVPYANYWCDVVYDGNKFVAIRSDYSNYAAYSTDGKSWTGITSFPSGDGTEAYMTIAYGGGKFVMCPFSGKRIMYSSDGITWEFANTSLSLPFSYCTSTAYGNGKFVVVSAQGKMAYSEDAITWTEVTPPVEGVNFVSIIYADGKFVASDNNNSSVIYSDNGIDWNIATIPGDITGGYVAYGDGLFMLFPSSLDAKGAFSYDGINWKTDKIYIDQNDVDITDSAKDDVRGR